MNDVLARWFEGHRAALFHYLLRILGDAEQAADALQDTALQTLRTWGGREPPLQLSAWIYRVATNKARDMLRRRHRWDWVPFHNVALSSESDSSLLTGFHVRRCLARLSALEAEALLLNLYAGWTCREIAALRDETPDAVRMRITRARRRFRELYQNEGGEDALS